MSMETAFVECGPEPYPLYQSNNHTRAVLITNIGKEEIWLGSYQIQGIPLASGRLLPLDEDYLLSEDWYATCVTSSLVSVTVIS